MSTARRAVKAQAQAPAPTSQEQQQLMLQQHQATAMSIVASSRIADASASGSGKLLEYGALKLSAAALKSNVPPWHAASALLLQALHKHAPDQV